MISIKGHYELFVVGFGHTIDLVEDRVLFGVKNSQIFTYVTKSFP
jgi:hypothetical protein